MVRAAGMYGAGVIRDLWKAYEVTDLAGTVELLYGKYWKNHIRQDKTLLFQFLCKDSSSYIGIFPKFFVF